jgi:cyclophilin family peptidyl-prolyl cis-trans isomerase
MAQGGDPQGTGQGGPGYTLPAEFTSDPKYSHTFGRLSMARTPDPDSAGSQFFICFERATFLDGKYTVFGEVSEGKETVEKIEAIGAERDPQKPKEIVKITKAVLVPLPPRG